MSYLALDPSFRGTGVLLVTRGAPVSSFKKVTEWGDYFLHFDKWRSPVPDITRFHDTLVAAQGERERLRRLLMEVKPEVSVMEYPHLHDSFSPGLYMLDALFLETLKNHVPRNFLLSTTAVFHFIGGKERRRIIRDLNRERRAKARAKGLPDPEDLAFKKSVVTRYAEEQLPPLPFKLNHDESTAFLLLKITHDRLRGFCDKPRLYEVPRTTGPIKEI